MYRCRDIVITPPVDPNSIGCARYHHFPHLLISKNLGPSIDLTLSNEFRYYKPGLNVVPIHESTDYKQVTEKVPPIHFNMPFIIIAKTSKF